jgi:hypothetical protein
MVTAKVISREKAWPSNRKGITDLLGPRQVEWLRVHSDDGVYHLLVTDQGEAFSWWEPCAWLRYEGGLFACPVEP